MPNRDLSHSDPELPQQESGGALSSLPPSPETDHISTPVSQEQLAQLTQEPIIYSRHFLAVSEEHIFKKIKKIDDDLALLIKYLENIEAKDINKKLLELEEKLQKKRVLIAASTVDLSGLFRGVNVSTSRDQELIPAASQLLYQKLNSRSKIKNAFLYDDFGRQSENISFSHGTHLFAMMLLALNQTLFNVMVHSPNLDAAEKNNRLNPFLTSFEQHYHAEKGNSWIPRFFQRCSMDAVLKNEKLDVTAKIKAIFDHGAYNPESRTFEVLATMAAKQAKSTTLLRR